MNFIIITAVRPDACDIRKIAFDMPIFNVLGLTRQDRGQPDTTESLKRTQARLHGRPGETARAIIREMTGLTVK